MKRLDLGLPSSGGDPGVLQPGPSVGSGSGDWKLEKMRLSFLLLNWGRHSTGFLSSRSGFESRHSRSFMTNEISDPRGNAEASRLTDSSGFVPDGGKVDRSGQQSCLTTVRSWVRCQHLPVLNLPTIYHSYT